MLAKLVKTEEDNFNLVLVKINEHDISHLIEGWPLRVTFYLDNREDLSWHERKCMVIHFGKDLNLEQQTSLYKKDKDILILDGLVDKDYLRHSLEQLKKKLVKATLQDLSRLLDNL